MGRGSRIAHFSPTRYRVDPFTQSFVRLPAADALRPQSAWHSLRPSSTFSGARPTRLDNYTGLTSNLAGRLDAHSAGRVPHTADGKPWIVDVIVEFADERRAVAFEKYLKSGSGCAFTQRHFR